MARYRNHYTCPNCHTEWYDESDGTQNDRCPICDLEVETDETTDIQVQLSQEDYDDDGHDGETGPGHT